MFSDVLGGVGCVTYWSLEHGLGEGVRLVLSREVPTSLQNDIRPLPFSSPWLSALLPLMFAFVLSG